MAANQAFLIVLADTASGQNLTCAHFAEGISGVDGLGGTGNEAAACS